MAEEITFTVTEPAFRAWLAAKRPRVYVGLRGNCWECPLARFIGEHMPDWVSRVDVDRMYMEGRVSNLPPNMPRLVWSQRTPMWAKYFIDDVDLNAYPHVTAQAALQRLDEALARMQVEMPHLYQQVLDGRAAA